MKEFNYFYCHFEKHLEKVEAFKGFVNDLSLFISHLSGKFMDCILR